MKAWISELLTWCFPEHCRCLFCGKEAELNEKSVCKECAKKLYRAPHLPALPGVNGVKSIFIYDELSGAPVKKLKYSNQRWYGRMLGRFLALPEDWKADAVLPVPLHPERLKQRGYNQSLLLAKALGETCGLPVEEDLLFRTKNTESQTWLSREERSKNIKNAFSCADRDRAQGRSFVIVDDVYTTGATTAECARVLKKCGAERVYVLTLLTKCKDGSVPVEPLYFEQRKQ